MEKATSAKKYRGPNNGNETGRGRKQSGAMAEKATRPGRRGPVRDETDGTEEKHGGGRGGRSRLGRGGGMGGANGGGGGEGGPVRGGGAGNKRGGGRDAGRGGKQKDGGGGGGGGGGRSKVGSEERHRSGAERNEKSHSYGRNGFTPEVGARRMGSSVVGRGGRGGQRGEGSRDRQERHGGRSDSAGRGRAAPGPRLGYKTLEELSGEDPSVVAITLSSHPALKDVLCETVMRQDLIELLCLVLSKAFQSQNDRASVQHLASILMDSGFFRTVLPHYLAGMMSEFNPLRRAKYPQHLENILAILSEVFGSFPASSVQTVSLLLTQLQVAMNSLSASEVNIQPQMEEAVGNLQGLVSHLQMRSREETLKPRRDKYSLLTNGDDNPGEEGQEDFRTIPIYPTPVEFHQDQRPFLRPNLTSQRYFNTHVYLDTHFRLLREDFVRPLRDGIQQLLWHKLDKGMCDNTLKAKRFDDILVYFDTKLLRLQCIRTGLAYTVQFDIQPLKFVRWENSKRLLYGSLVCLSCDNFESLLFATVTEREPKELQKGRIQIMFNEESRLKLAGMQMDQEFLMVESTAYFEAYRYVLEGLLEQKEDDLPFQRYIVECNKDVQPPAYLQKQDTYDLSSIVKPIYKDSVRPFHSLKAEAWPDMEKLGLDESQMRALQLALTKELAIIQGPPGTGKTHVGLKIAQALLTNRNLWVDESGNGVILVVCYTNHALDQFLEGIHKFLKKGIVRVGGRSNSEILKSFNLRELINSAQFRRSLPRHLRFAFPDILKELEVEEGNIQDQRSKLKCCLKGILHENILQKFIKSRHWNSLHQPLMDIVFGPLHKKFSYITEWLCLGSMDILQRETENEKRNEVLDVADAEALQMEGEDLIEIAEEADLIQAERIIEDIIAPIRGRDRKKKRNWTTAVREVEEQMLAMNLDEAEIRTEQNEEEWEMQHEQKKKLKKKIQAELQKSSFMTEEEEERVFDVWSLSLPDRWRLYRSWIARYRLELSSAAQEFEQAYQNTVRRLAEVKQHESICLLGKATVIGMTTTGAAKYRAVLQEVRPRLVIVEEAAQVLEAHTITTLSQACQHLILIGDHQQLHPSATVYDLAKNFNLEVSMFERLVKMGIPYVRLNYQHRMRPEIARLLTPHIYPELENHPSVLDYENIKGLNTNLFFVEHNHPEEINEGKSRHNQHEAKFVVALCRYLLLQEYTPQQITILTTYTSQLHCLRKLMPASMFAGVRVHVVDKYQGEENDIILLSLVRSNTQGKVGFLSIPNRVCVALSRAKKCLYCIGSSATLHNVKLWSNIFQTLSENNQIDKALTLCCQNHPDRLVKAACAEDFKQAPEGGCTEPCQFRLDCGHVCTRVCHPYDPEHKKYKCVKKCQSILCDQGHICPLVCYKKCPEDCPVKVEKIIPQCQHTQMVPCHQDPETFECQEPCQKMLKCGHPCQAACGELCTTMCKATVTLVLKCGHNQQDACYYTTLSMEPECRTPCDHQLNCGHRCSGSCTKCYQGRFHLPCFGKRRHPLICSHTSKSPCFCDSLPCQRQCENYCVHSKCMKLCGLPCTPCTEPCVWQCPHHRCGKLCHEPCDRPPCNQPCANTLDCGHPCIGLCGEKCPRKCRICDHIDVTFGNEHDPEARFIQLEDCGHIFECTVMDKYMGIDKNNKEEGAIKLKQCPKCRTPIRKNLRYGSCINRILTEIEMVKVKMNGNPREIEKHRRALLNQWREKVDLYKIPQEYECEHITDGLSKGKVTANDLWVLENKMDFLTRVAKLLKLKNNNMSVKQGTKFAADVAEFVVWLNNRNQTFTDQQVFDLQRQLWRLTFIAELNVRCHEADKTGQSDDIQSEIQTIRQILVMPGQFTELDEQKVKETMKTLDQKLPNTGLGITEEERKTILPAMEMSSGHWFKCPNGHVYPVTQFRGAMTRRRCPDCDATGSNHMLESAPLGAFAIDGAQQPA